MDLSLINSPDLWSYIAGQPSATFDNNAGVNPLGAQTTAPVITSANGTSSPSTSFLQSIGQDISGLTSIANPILSSNPISRLLGINPSPTSTKPGTGPAGLAGIGGSSPWIWLALLGLGGVLLGVLLFRRR